MSVQFNFNGKVVLITGSSSGIGAATAIEFVKSGASVVVTGPQWDATNVTKVAQQCRQLMSIGAKVTEVVADVTNEDDLTRLVDKTIAENGKLDVLINNAGALFPTQVFDNKYCLKFSKTIDLCLTSAMKLTHFCIPYLSQTKGCIINISSVAGLRSGVSHVISKFKLVLAIFNREFNISCY